MAHLKLVLLGIPRIELDGKPIGFETRKAVALLSYLAVSGQRHGRDALIALLWPESDRKRGRSALRRTLSPLNSAFDGFWLDADNETIALAPNGDFWLDVAQFQHLAESWRRHGHTRRQPCDACLDDLAAAVALYQDDFMAGFTLADCPEYDNWQTYQRERLHQARTDALQRLAQGHAERRQYARAITYARQAVALDPLHEPAHRQLMLLHVWAGDRAAALRQYEACVRQLDSELGAPPMAETQHLCQVILQDMAPPPPPPPAPTGGGSHTPLPRHHLPARLTSFVGRTDDVKAVALRLAHARLVTLTGPGGCGKTSLAVETARQLAEGADLPKRSNGSADAAHFDAIHFVELLPLTDGALLAQTVLTALGLEGNANQPPAQTLVQFWGSRHVLLILDNCEHLIEAVAHLVETLLGGCAHLRVLATSRERLAIGAETLFSVGPLALPGEQARRDVESAMRYAAVQLFTERTQAVTPRFRLAPHNVDAVLRICTLLDGLPLALELAAAATATFSVAEIAQQLEARQLLADSSMRTADPRHRRLSDTVEWSYKLLSPAEQRTLVHLAVFVGGWTADAMQHVLPDQDRALSLLHQLVRKSLVGVDQVEQPEGGRTRYFLLRAIREYGLARFSASADQGDIRRRHFAYYTHYATRLGDAVMGAEHRQAMAGLDADYHNIRAAAQYAFDKPDLGEARVRMAAALTYYWRLRNHTLRAEGLGWLQAALEPQTTCSLPAQALACGALLSLGCIDPLHAFLNLGAAWHGIQQLIAVGEALLAEPALAADSRSRGRLLLGLADAHRFPGGLDKCRDYVVLAITALEAAGDLRNLGFAYNMLTWLDQMQANTPAVGDHQAANLRVAQASGSPWALCEAYLVQASLAGAAGNRIDQIHFIKLLMEVAEQHEFLSQLYVCLQQLESADQALAMQMVEGMVVRWRSRPAAGVLSLALHQLGRMYINTRQCEAAAAVLDEAIDLWRRRSGDQWQTSALEWSLTERGGAAYLLGDYAGALNYLSESIALFAGVPFTGGSLWPRFYRGFAHLAVGELRSAEDDFRQCIELVIEGFVGWQKLAVWALAGLGEIAHRRGELALSGRLLGAAATLDMGLPEPSAHARYGEVQGFLRCMAAAIEYHHDAAFAQAWQAGARLTFEEAVGLPLAPGTSDHAGAIRQTPRPAGSQ